jgi:hypothetical protein
MNDTTLRSILTKAIACFNANTGSFAALEVNSMRIELEAIDARAAKDAERSELDRINRESGAAIVYALDDFAKSLGFVQVASYERSRHPLERHEIAHMSRDWFLVDVSRAGTRLRVEVCNESAGRSVLQRVHDGADLQTIASKLGGGSLIQR